MDFECFECKEYNKVVVSREQLNDIGELIKNTNIKSLYHGTIERNLKSIMESGLNPEYCEGRWEDVSEKGVIYLSSTSNSAEVWAEDDEDLSAEVAILEIDVDRIDLSKLSLDQKLLEDNCLVDFEYAGVIPPDAIKVIPWGSELGVYIDVEDI